MHSAISAYTSLADLAVEFRLALSPHIFKVSHVEAESVESNSHTLGARSIDLTPNVWLHSSVGRASHRYRGGHGFESR